MLEFIDRHDLSFANIEDGDGQVFSEYGVPYQPAWVFLAADGTLTRVQGSLDDARLAEYIAEII
ncbi:MAG: soluble secreted antigen Mpt53 precursor [Actinomycetota bacterium]|jgi:peroxiredoxin